MWPQVTGWGSVCGTSRATMRLQMMLVRAGAVTLCLALLLASCTNEPAALKASVAAPEKASPVSASITWSKNAFAPSCKLDGCCEGHGDVAYVQPDRFIMCTDGEPSQICDCH